LSLAAFLDLLGGRRAQRYTEGGWRPEKVASFVPWPKRKPGHMQKLDAPTRFVSTRYERLPDDPDIFCLYISPSFGTGYSFTASGNKASVNKLLLRLEGAEERHRKALIEEYIRIAETMTRKATGAGIPSGILAIMRDPERSTFDYSKKSREIARSGLGYNFSDFAAVAHEPYYRAFVYEIFAPCVVKTW
jgi:hypothetical protein